MLVSVWSLTNMGEPIARPRRFTDEDILDATQACILEYGPSVSTNMIAERMGMSQAALFKRFGTKEKLIVAALSRPLKHLPLAEAMAAGPSDAPIKSQLTNMALGILFVMRKVVPCMAMLHAAGIDPKDKMGHHDSPPMRARKLLTAWFQSAMDQGRIRRLDPHIMAVGFLGNLIVRPFRETILGDTELQCSDEAYVQQLIDQLWSGIGVENP